MTQGTTRRESTIPALGQLAADWRFPERPLVPITLDGKPVASADYLEASASAHWFIRWEPHPRVPEHEGEIALSTLAGQVPEDIDVDEGLRVGVLDTALRAAASQLHVNGDIEIT